MRLSLDPDPQEKADICRWIEASPAHAVAFAKAEAAWEAAEALKGKVADAQNSVPAISKRRKVVGALLVGSFAAGCALVVLQKMI